MSKEYFHELVEHMPGFTSKKMFSSIGIFYERHMIAIITDAGIYAKSCTATNSWPAFTYRRKGKDVTLGFHRIPIDVAEDTDALREVCMAVVKERLNTKNQLSSRKTQERKRK